MNLEEIIDKIAETCHEVNREYCIGLGDYGQVCWSQAEEWQRQSARDGVRWRLANMNAPVSAQHENWAQDKLAQGWRYGPDKNADAREHPCLMSYEELPVTQRIKDSLFAAVVMGLAAKYYEDLRGK